MQVLKIIMDCILPFSTEKQKTKLVSLITHTKELVEKSSKKLHLENIIVG